MIVPTRQEFFDAKDDTAVKIYNQRIKEIQENCMRALQCENVDEVLRHLEYIEWDFDSLNSVFQFILRNYQEVVIKYNEAMDYIESIEEDE